MMGSNYALYHTKQSEQFTVTDLVLNTVAIFILIIVLFFAVFILYKLFKKQK